MSMKRAPIAGETLPIRTADIGGTILPLYAPPGGHGLPWVASEPLFKAIGLDPARVHGFSERNGLNRPDACNIVRGPGGNVCTLSPDAALRCAGMARQAGAITDETLAALRAVIGANEPAKAT